ncbi:hypothetical protein CCACVL1_24282 [Corchorus capsularis]|uniref:RRP12 HEAT domain-containing protein n=1 Tax=Corchorus capsularis TaxID=210143 RepID=A0A1R3GQ74_COCAP|nr:hypothetical protein CCACVL1_24282 [Corchorus capsularis]
MAILNLTFFFRYSHIVVDVDVVLLTSEATASQASAILKELISHHIELKSYSADNDGIGNEEADAIKSICAIFENTLNSTDGIPNKHVLAVLATLFPKIGESSYIFMKSIVHKLADFMTLASGDMSKMNHLQNCIGSAVTVIGPERILTLLPITLHSDNFNYSNVWLIPVLKNYVVGASLRSLENIAVALQILVNQNKSIIRSEKDTSEASNFTEGDSVAELGGLASYSKKSATRNMKALSSCASELLQALIDAFVCSLAAKRLYLKDAIKCLASITDSSITKRIFMSLVDKLQLVDDEGEFEKQAGNANVLMEKGGNTSTMEKGARRRMIMELASSIVPGAEEDLIDFIYALVKKTFQETDEIGHAEAYCALSRVLEEHAWFCSSRFRGVD